MSRWVGQLPSICGVTLFLPPCKLGSSLVLILVVDAYKSWNLEGNGGRSGEVSSSRFRFNVKIVWSFEGVLCSSSEEE